MKLKILNNPQFQCCRVLSHVTTHHHHPLTGHYCCRCGAGQCRQKKEIKFKEADDRQKQPAILVVVFISLIQSQSFRKSRNPSIDAIQTIQAFKNKTSLLTKTTSRCLIKPSVLNPTDCWSSFWLPFVANSSARTTAFWLSRSNIIHYLFLKPNHRGVLVQTTSGVLWWDD